MTIANHFYFIRSRWVLFLLPPPPPSPTSTSPPPLPLLIFFSLFKCLRLFISCGRSLRRRSIVVFGVLLQPVSQPGLCLYCVSLDYV